MYHNCPNYSVRIYIPFLSLINAMPLPPGVKWHFIKTTSASYTVSQISRRNQWTEKLILLYFFLVFDTIFEEINIFLYFFLCYYTLPMSPKAAFSQYLVIAQPSLCNCSPSLLSNNDCYHF